MIRSNNEINNKYIYIFIVIRIDSSVGNFDLSCKIRTRN